MGTDLLRRHGGALLLLLTAATWLGVVGAGFVWDDHGLLSPRAGLSDGTELKALLLGDLWARAPGAPVHSGYFRPLVALSFALDQAAFGAWAPGYHLHSLAWHLLAVATLHRLLAGLLPWPQALAAAAVFSLHPVQSEAVTWIAARNDPMAAALGLGALLAVRPARVGPGRLAIGALLAMLGLLAKESVVLLPLLLLLLDLGAEGRPGPARRWLALLLGLGLGLGLRLAVGVDGGGAPDPVGVALLLDQAPRLVAVLGAALSVSWPLAATRSLEWLGWEPTWRVGVGLATAAVLLLLPAALPAPRRRLALVGLAWLLATLAPTLLPIADKGLIGERYLYLGVVGLALWLAGALAHRLPWLVLALLLPWQALVRDRLPDWRDDDRLWLAAWQDTGTPYAQAGLGLRLQRAGRSDLALPLLVGALDQDPPAQDACAGLLAAALDQGGPVLAEPLGRWALRRGCPRAGVLAGTLAAVQAQLGQWDRAERTLDGAGPDPTGRDTVVRIALLQRAGAHEQAAALLATTPDPASVRAQVDGLLGSSSGTPPGILPPPASER